MSLCMRSVQLCLQRSALFLIARLVQKCKHVFLITLNARLIEGVDAQHIAGKTACLFEEVNKIAEFVLIDFRHL